MPSFDIVSRIDMTEVKNAVNQATKEISQRFDFRGVEATIEEQTDALLLKSDSEHRVRAVLDVLESKLLKRGVELSSLEIGKIESAAGGKAKLTIKYKQGIGKELAKDVLKRIKESAIKVQATIQEDELRVTGKKRDDLQEVIAMLKAADVGQPLQFVNFRE